MKSARERMDVVNAYLELGELPGCGRALRHDPLAGKFEPDRQAWERRRAERPTYQAGETAKRRDAEHQLGYIE